VASIGLTSTLNFMKSVYARRIQTNSHADIYKSVLSVKSGLWPNYTDTGIREGVLTAVLLILQSTVVTVQSGLLRTCAWDYKMTEPSSLTRQYRFYLGRVRSVAWVCRVYPQYIYKDNTYLKSRPVRSQPCPIYRSPVALHFDRSQCRYREHCKVDIEWVT